MTRFDYFVVLAGMRTGSNFLEANINALRGVKSLGEVFNPGFLGYPGIETLLGMTLDQREADPRDMIDRIKSADELCGFRLFNDHDPRVLAICLADPRCAKIVLTRNPLDSYISLRIAQATGQWKLTNAPHAKSVQVGFDADVFADHLETTQAFHLHIQNALQVSGQTAFYIGYEDLNDLAVLNGLAAFLDTSSRLDSIDKKLKKQNPEPMEQRVTNFDQMQDALSKLDPFSLARTPHFEPRRGAGIPTYIAASNARLLYMPLRSGPDWAVVNWMAAIEGGKPRDLQRKFTQKTLRDWQQTRVGHRSFTVLRHPIARAHAAFCDRILSNGAGSFAGVRASLRKQFRLPIPEEGIELTGLADYDAGQHRDAFLGFLRFLRGNLAGQTSLRIDPSWAGQLTLLQGMAEFNIPDMILREDRLAQDLRTLADQVGVNAPPDLIPSAHNQHGVLGAIYDKAIENAARDAYGRDYAAFGFDDWA